MKKIWLILSTANKRQEAVDLGDRACTISCDLDFDKETTL